jgi:hypothetical protein
MGEPPRRRGKDDLLLHYEEPRRPGARAWPDDRRVESGTAITLDRRPRLEDRAVPKSKRVRLLGEVTDRARGGAS